MIRANSFSSVNYELGSTVYYSLHGSAVNISCNTGDYILSMSTRSDNPTVTGMTLVNSATYSTNQYVRLYKADSATPTFTSGGSAGESYIVVMTPA